MSKIKYDKLTVVDFEATNNEGREIIEMGLCTLNVKTLTITNKLSMFVKPEFTKLNDFIKELTGITEEDLEFASSLKESCDHLIELGYNKNPWASYGAFDRSLLEEECKNKKIKFPFTNRHIDIKTLFPIVFNTKEVGLQKAINKLGLYFEGRNHSAADDAYNAAKVFAECLRGGKLKNG